MATVLAVLNNYARHANIAPIAERMYDQGCDVIVADNATAQQDEYYAAWSSEAGVRDIWSWRVNAGPPARWWPALAVMHEYDYLMFLDDDFLPRVGLVESLLQQAAACGDRFSAIGRIGRFFIEDSGGWHYVRAKLRTPHKPINMTGGGEFIVADRLLAAVAMRNALAASGVGPRLLLHDDLLLDLGIQRTFGFPPYTADGGWEESKLNTCGYTFSSKTPEFKAERDAVINACYACGWRPVKWVHWNETGRE